MATLDTSKGNCLLKFLTGAVFLCASDDHRKKSFCELLQPLPLCLVQLMPVAEG